MVMPRGAGWAAGVLLECRGVRRWPAAAGEAGGDADEIGEALRMNGMPGRIEEGLGETLG